MSLAGIDPLNVFSGVIGHHRVMSLLGDEISQPAHAYLFVGPNGVGKATVARLFAAALLCEVSGQHDEECSSCRRVNSGNHPDLVLVEADGASSLGVDQARMTISAANLTPVEGARKIILIAEAGLMTDSAANALLKTIEEPTASTMFLLVTESDDDLPATVASRCRTVQFGRVAEADLQTALEKAGLAPQQAQDAARISGGRPGLALALATQPDVATFREAWLKVPSRVTPKPGEAFRLAEELAVASEPLLEAIKERHDNEAMDTDTKAIKQRREREIKRAAQALMITGLEILASWYSDAAVAQFGGEVRNRDVDAADLLLVRPATAVRNADLVLDAVTSLRANQRQQLVLADLFTHLGVSA